MTFCHNCGVEFDQFGFATHGQHCPHRARAAGEALYRDVIECTPGVAADLLAAALKKAFGAGRLAGMEEAAALLERPRCRTWLPDEGAAQIRAQAHGRPGRPWEFYGRAAAGGQV